MPAQLKKGEYQALARKYRPRTFAEVVGQRHVIAALSHAVDAGRVHHACLLTGTRGIGKTTIARILARCLECEHGVSSTPCGECTACREISSGVFPDVVEIDAASQTRVDDTRQLLENTRYPPVRGRYKIYIIDEVHMLTSSSFNALLKTLEEPPDYVKFILATTDPRKIPATVLSRCMQFQLMALTREEIFERITRIAALEDVPCEPEAAQLLAGAARGSMRDALSLCDQALALGAGELRHDSVQAMLGNVGDNLIRTLMDLLAPDSAAELSSVLEEVHRTAPAYSSLLDTLATAFHDLALYQMTGGSRLNLFSMPKNFLESYAGVFSADSLQLYYQCALQGMEEFRVFPDGAAVFDMALLRMLAFTPEKKKRG